MISLKHLFKKSNMILDLPTLSCLSIIHCIYNNNVLIYILMAKHFIKSKRFLNKIDIHEIFEKRNLNNT